MRWALLVAGILTTGCANDLANMISAGAKSDVDACAYSDVSYVGRAKQVYCRIGAPGSKITVTPEGVMTISRQHEPQGSK